MRKARLSVNVNKYALLRNSRGQDAPNLLHAVDMCLEAGAHGITVHPRLDQRHIHLDDVPAVAEHLRRRWPGVELNVECEDADVLIDLVLDVRPEQVTLVPVTPGEITSDHGWSLPEDRDRLRPTVARLVEAGLRVSLFADPVPDQVERFVETGAHRVEIYTGPFAWAWGTADQEEQTRLVVETARRARAAGLEVNAGHDLDRHNLAGVAHLGLIDEVSIGHAQIVRALEVGTDQSVKELLTALGW